MPIAKQDLDALLNRGRVLLTGASDAGLKAELYDVLAEFFTDSGCWLETIPFNVLSDTNVYDVNPSEGQIIRLIGVFDSNGSQQAAVMPIPGKVNLQNFPNQQQGDLVYYAVVAKTVTMPTTKDMVPIGPDWVLPQYHIGILDGLLGKMRTQINQSWSNQVSGIYHLKRFRSAIAGARVAAVRQHTWGSQSWSFPSFARGTQTAGGRGRGPGSDRSF